MSKETLRSEEARAALLARLRTLTPSSAARWGSLTAPRMLCHVADSMRVALGDMHAQPWGSPLKRTVMRWLVVNTPVRPPQGRAKTIPEMLSTQPTTWAADLAACERLLERVAATESGTQHPIFGPLSADGVARLTWKHVDHHLRQFGA